MSTELDADLKPVIKCTCKWLLGEPHHKLGGRVPIRIPKLDCDHHYPTKTGKPWSEMTTTEILASMDQVARGNRE